MFFPLPYVLIQVLQNRGLLYYEIDDMENALQDFLATAKVHSSEQSILSQLSILFTGETSTQLFLPAPRFRL